MVNECDISKYEGALDTRVDSEEKRIVSKVPKVLKRHRNNTTSISSREDFNKTVPDTNKESTSNSSEADSITGMPNDKEVSVTNRNEVGADKNLKETQFDDNKIDLTSNFGNCQEDHNRNLLEIDEKKDINSFDSYSIGKEEVKRNEGMDNMSKMANIVEEEETNENISISAETKDNSNKEVGVLNMYVNPPRGESDNIVTAKRIVHGRDYPNKTDTHQDQILESDKVVTEYDYSYQNYLKRSLTNMKDVQYCYNATPGICNTAINCTITKIKPELQEKILINFPENKDISSQENIRFLEATLGLLKFKRIFKNKTYREQGYKYKSEFQLKVLNDILRITPYPGSQTRDSLAILLNLNPRSIQIWFQNARQGSEKQISREELKSHRVKNYIDLGTIIKIYYKYLYE